MRVGISIPEKPLKWRKSPFALEVLALGNRQRVELFGGSYGGCEKLKFTQARTNGKTLL